MEKTWDALVNPECDIANSFLHKITDADVAQAPTFADIANTVASLLAGRMMVAHNASFEQRFLRQEFARLGVVWPAYGDWIIDTQEFSTQFLGKAKLQEALDAAGIINFRPHSALSDAMSAGKWLQWLAQQDSDITFNTGQLFIYPSGLPNPLASLSRSSGIDADEQRWLLRLVKTLPRVSMLPTTTSLLPPIPLLLFPQMASMPARSRNWTLMQQAFWTRNTGSSALVWAGLI